MKKVIVIGCPGAGKTTCAAGLSAVLSLPLYHLDAIWHKPDRTHITREAFDARLQEILTQDAYIIDGNYSRTLEQRIAAADTVIFFDLPPEVCLQGAIDRLGKVRVDMPWCDTVLDESFRAEILAFSDACRPDIYRLIDIYKEGKRIVIFKSRKEADDFLRDLGARK